VLCTLLIFMGMCAECGAQVITMQNDSMSAEQYASDVAKLYEHSLQLTPTQLWQTYTTVLKRKRTLDSVRIHKVHVTQDKLWTLDISLDSVFKKILSTRQYMDYMDMRSKQMMRFKAKDVKKE
jgi:hypothetical protein